jgi:thioredoxin-like negative regulator of GroEL
MIPLAFKDYQKEVQDFPGTVILFFTSPWDTPGLKTAKFLRSFVKDGVKIFSVDYDSERELVQKFSVRVLPILFSLKAGEVVSTVSVCETPEQLQNLLEEK